MPKDSFVLKYFQHLKAYLSVGPPTYFVLKGKINLTNPLEQNIICGGLGCSSESLSTKINMASKYPSQSFIARPASSWLDDYFDWSHIKGCCKMNKSKFLDET
jgi:Niemann-Pick C1 protein